MSAGRKEFSLLELNARVRDALQEALPERYWVRAEISEARIHPSGHCYLELIEKEESTGRTVAKARATIWATTFRLLRPWFEQSTGQLFTSGIKILVLVSPVFHELYGYSLHHSRHRPHLHPGRCRPPQGSHLAATARRRGGRHEQGARVATATATVCHHLLPLGRRVWRLHEPAAKQSLRLPRLHGTLPGLDAGRADRTLHHRGSRPHCLPRGVVRRRGHHSGRGRHLRPQQFRQLSAGRQRGPIPPARHHRHRPRARRHRHRPGGQYPGQDPDSRRRVDYRPPARSRPTRGRALPLDKRGGTRPAATRETDIANAPPRPCRCWSSDAF